MSWLAVIPWVVVTVIGLALAFPTRSMVLRTRRDFVRRADAHLDPVFEAAFDKDTRKMARLLAAMFWVGSGISLVLARYLDSHPSRDVNIWLVIVPVVATLLALYPIVRLHSVDRVFRVAGSSTSVARPVRVVVSDYVGGWTRLLTWTAVAIVVGLAAALALLWRRGDVSGALAAISAVDAGIALGLMGITHWFGRVLCERPTPAVDASHLYLQDAWRSALLSRAHTNVGYICHLLFYGLLLSGGPLNRIIDTAAFPLVIAAISAWPLLQYVQPRQFRRRLWRTLLPGQVLLPGQQLPPPAGAGA